MSQRKESRDSEGDKEDFKIHFPVLFKEIVEGEDKIDEEEIRTTKGLKIIRKFTGYTPSVVDFICRCSSEEEAMEIIEYMLSKGDISENHAKELKKQLNERGLDFFGEHRAPGFYEKV